MSDKCRKLRRLFVLPDVSFACLFRAVFQLMLSAFLETSFKRIHLHKQTMLKQSVHKQFHRNNAKRVRSMLPTEFYKFKGLGVEGQKTLFNSRNFCMQRRSAVQKGRTAFNSPLCLGRSLPAVSPINCGLCGVIFGFFISLCLFVTWILLQ